jgi:hypothetical protein
MDNCRFDNLTRVIAVQADRRTAVKALAGTVAALATLARAELGFAQIEVGIEVDCRDNGERCRRDDQCCSLKCKKKNGKKRCKCAGTDSPCKADIGCCQGICDDVDNTCRCGNTDEFCNNDNDCCSNDCSEERKCKCIKDNERCADSNNCCGTSTCKDGFCKP